MISPTLQAHLEAQQAFRKFESINIDSRRQRFEKLLRRDAAELIARQVSPSLQLRALSAMAECVGEEIVPDAFGYSLQIIGEVQNAG